MYTRLYRYALYWDWLMCNSCKCSFNSTKFPIFCDTLYVASVAEKWLPWIKFTGATLALVDCYFSYTLS